MEFPFNDASRLAAYFLGRVRHHPDFEDIHAELVTAIWKSWDRHGTRWSLTTYAKTLAPQQIGQWFRSPRGRLYGRLTLQNDDGDEVDMMEEDVNEERLCPDFTSSVIDQVFAERIWDYVWGQASERQRQALVLIYRDGRSIREASREMGLQGNAARTVVQAALNRYRRRVGLPLQKVGGDK